VRNNVCKNSRSGRSHPSPTEADAGFSSARRRPQPATRDPGPTGDENRRPSRATALEELLTKLLPPTNPVPLIAPSFMTRLLCPPSVGLIANVWSFSIRVSPLSATSSAQRARKTTIVNREQERMEQRLVLGIEWAVDEDVAVLLAHLQASSALYADFRADDFFARLADFLAATLPDCFAATRAAFFAASSYLRLSRSCGRIRA
jgi:hypothetical protein